jgi:hypothetical protein
MQHIYDPKMSDGLGGDQNRRKKDIYEILIPKIRNIQNILFCPEYSAKLLSLYWLQMDS